jgi:tocopherol cyclase
MKTTDRFHHLSHQQRGFFEGWYFKHQIDQHVYAFIPGISIDERGRKHVFIQAISESTSHYFTFPTTALKIDGKAKEIIIGDNLFSLRGVNIALRNDVVKIEGNLSYRDLYPIKQTVYAPSIMGPFSYLTFMECYHGILSMAHSIEGTLIWNDETIDFTTGKGYIEKDWGTSFPSAYIWIQCNQFLSDEIRLFFSVADIPFLGLSFKGVICVLQIGNKEYRFATYYGGKVTNISRQKDLLILSVEQKDLRLTIEVATSKGHNLQAPISGEMSRIIREHARTTIRVTLSQDGQEILSEKGNLAGFEEVGKVQGFHY